MGWVNNLQLLRGLAAAMVVLLHAVASGGGAPVSLGFFDPLGNAGVDLFFVLSGYLMMALHREAPRTPGRFLADRAGRILPLYWAMLVVLLVGREAGLFAARADDFIDIASSFLLVSQPLVGDWPILYVGWTLEYEGWFYLCFAAAMVGAARLRADIDLTILLAALILLLVAVLGADAMAFEFLAGALVARLLPLVAPARRRGLGLAGIAIGIAGLCWSVTLADPKPLRLVAWGIPMTGMLVAGLTLPQVGHGLLTRLGDTSYALYLTHPFVIHTMADRSFPMSAAGQWWLMLASCFAVGALVHYRLEKPLTRLTRRWLRAPRRSAAPATA